MSMILGNKKFEQEKTASAKTYPSKSDATQTLNFGNVSKQVSFNDGNNEGYYKVRPKALSPSNHNPRPDWIINDDWLIQHVGIDMNDIFETNMDSACLVKIIEEEIDGKNVESIIYPEFSELKNNPNIAQKNEYEFLISLSKSIREVGQIQPIEIESNTESKTLIVLEGHLRRLACILGRVPYIKAIRNEGLQHLTRKEKINRQITENSLRTNVSVFGHFKLAYDEIKEDPKISIRELSTRLKIKKDLASSIIKLVLNPEKYHSLIIETLKDGHLSSNNFIKVVSITRQDQQVLFLNKLLKKNKIDFIEQEKKVAPRGIDGRKRSVASMQIKSKDNCIKAGNKLLQYLPELSTYAKISNVASVEDMVNLLKSLETFLLDTKNEEIL